MFPCPFCQPSQTCREAFPREAGEEWVSGSGADSSAWPSLAALQADVQICSERPPQKLHTAPAGSPNVTGTQKVSDSIQDLHTFLPASIPPSLLPFHISFNGLPSSTLTGYQHVWWEPGAFSNFRQSECQEGRFEFLAHRYDTWALTELPCCWAKMWLGA